MSSPGDVPPPPRHGVVYGILALGVAAVSSAAVLIRLAEAPALTIAAYRLTLASLMVAPLGLATSQRQWRELGPREWGLAGASGACLALHFGFWIASLHRTSVASSVVIVTSNPIFVALAAHLLLKERATWRVLAGIGLGLLGGVVIGLGDWDLGREKLYGDALALLGALAVAGYYLAGRRLRLRLSLWGYVVPVYAGGALLLLAVAGLTDTPLWGFSGITYSYLALVALVPQLLGHTSLNWALGHLPAAAVATAVMAEPVGATLLAWAVLNEAPPVLTVAGGGFILAGVYLALGRAGG